MTDRDALLAAVHAAPLDDAPRLVLADWLDEHGESDRGEFIRLQVAQRREFESHGRTRRLNDLFVRARALFYRPWAEPVRSVFGRGIALYSRGFPKGPAYAIPAECLIAHLPVVATWIGPDTDIRVQVLRGQFKDLAGVPELRWVRNLSVQRAWRTEPEISEADIADLLASPHLGNLRSVGLSGLGLTNATGFALREACGLMTLETLDLHGNRIGRAGALALADAAHLASLRHLDLSNNQIGNAAVKALLRSPHLTGLKSLNLRDNPYTIAVAPLIDGRFPNPRTKPNLQ